MENQPIADKIKEIIMPLLNEAGVKLVEMTYRRIGRNMLLRLLVDKSTGITLDECSDLNSRIGDVLDAEEFLSTSYILEVSSPGLDRPITARDDFERLIGKKMEIFLKDSLNGKLQYNGILEKVGEDFLLIRDKADSINIPLDTVNKGKLTIGFGKLQGRGERL